MAIPITIAKWSPGKWRRKGTHTFSLQETCGNYRYDLKSKNKKTDFSCVPAFTEREDQDRIIIFESNESIVSGEVVYLKFQSLTNRKGWYINKNLSADGPGSSTVVIENNQNKCLIHWSQHSWIDEKSNEYRQSEQIKLIVQCTS